MDTTETDTEADGTVSNLEQASLMIKTDLCSVSKQLDIDESGSSVNEYEDSSFLAEETTFTEEDTNVSIDDSTVSDEDFTAAIEMDTTVRTDESANEAPSPMILDTFSLKENGSDIDGKLLVSD